MSDLKPLPSWDSEATWSTFETGLFHGVVGGVEIQKSADDLERYRELVEASQPDVLIETGTRAGGSALWFNRELNLRVFTIDIAPQWATRGDPPDTRADIDWITGSSTAGWVADCVEQKLASLGEVRVMVSLDSDHHAAHVFDEIAVWAEFVSDGCYLVIEDACFDMWEPKRARVGGLRIPEVGGTLAAINDRATRDTLTREGFRRDEALESRTPISHSPVGWWRKDA